MTNDAIPAIGDLVSPPTLDEISAPPAADPCVVGDDLLVLIEDARTHLESMLADAGVTSDAPAAVDVATIVEVFQRFAAVPVEDAAPTVEDGDGVLAQFATYDFRGEPEFSVDLTRQLIEHGDEDAPMWQLSCTLCWRAGADTNALGEGNLWSFGLPLEEFLAEVRRLPGWAWALRSAEAPRELVLRMGEV